jgi:hypothetical protein
METKIGKIRKLLKVKREYDLKIEEAKKDTVKMLFEMEYQERVAFYLTAAHTYGATIYYPMRRSDEILLTLDDEDIEYLLNKYKHLEEEELRKKKEQLEEEKEELQKKINEIKI